MRDPILSSLFVVALEVGISYLAAMRGIEYVRRLVWLQVVLCVAIASNVIPSNLYDFHLTGIYMSVLIGLVVADTELYIRGKREVLLTSARDSMSIMLSSVFLLAPVLPASFGKSTAFFVGAALSIIYGSLYSLYHYAQPHGRIWRATVAVTVGNSALSLASALAGVSSLSAFFIDYAMHLGTSLLTLVSVHMALEASFVGERVPLSAPKYTRK